MGNGMTCAAGGKLLVDRLAVRFPVTVLTCRQIPVPRMTLGAGKGRMLGGPLLKQIERLLVTTGTDRLGLGQWVVDLHRGVHRVAGKAIGRCQFGQRAMVLMTLITLRNPAMLLGVAGRTFLFRMLARLGGQHGGNVRMAFATTILEQGRIGNRGQGLVGIGVAVQTLHNLRRRSMGFIMATGALGHDLRIIVLRRIIGMKHLVALSAYHLLVLVAMLLEPGKM